MQSQSKAKANQGESEKVHKAFENNKRDEFESSNSRCKKKDEKREERVRKKEKNFIQIHTDGIIQMIHMYTEIWPRKNLLCTKQYYLQQI